MADIAPLAWLLGRLRPVRVRITLAATVATALATVAAAWLLIHSVEDTQLADLRREAEAELAHLADQLAAGQRPLTVSIDATVQPLLIEDEQGNRHTLVPEPAASGVVSSAGGVSVVEDGLVPTFEVPVHSGSLPAGAGAPEASPGDPVEQDHQVAGGGSGEAHGAGGAGGGSGEAHDAVPESDVVVQAASGDAADVEEVSQVVDTPDGQVTITGFLPVDEVGRSVDAVRRALALGLPGLVGLVGLATWWLVGRALVPVEAIRAEAEAIGGSTLDRRVPEPRTDDEVGRLAGTMNAMLDRLDVAVRRQRQFVSDASHELRSPVAAIRTDLEVALTEGEEADWPTVARAVLAEEGRMERLLGDLLTLAADDERGPGQAGVAPGGGATVDLAAVVAEEAARARRVPVTLTAADTPGPVPVVGDGGQLRRLVANLLDNAARHARTRVEVTVATSVGGHEVQLTVADDGPGIPAADRERVFDRFVRLDEGRARDDGGAGLGLAVVRAVAHRHGGTARAEDGSRLVVTLPAPNLP